MAQLSLGIVGLPNVGKSTLFNALTNQAVLAANYPFATIDPNVGIVPVMDPRLDKLAELVKPAKVTPAVVEFWDIAGLVKGAATGAGLGNKFLSNIRNVSAIVHVVRAFQNDNITHVENRVDPVNDIELINAELILKDLETLERKVKELEGHSKTDSKLIPFHAYFLQMLSHMNSGKLANEFAHSQNEEIEKQRADMFLLTDKPMIFVINSEESKITENVEKLKPLLPTNSTVMGMDIKMEAEIAALPIEDRQEYLVELGLNEPAIARLTREAYNLLGLISYFTAGETEVRAWTITKGMKAPQAAGVIHTDFEKKFIVADVVTYPDFISSGGWLEARQQGKVKLGGKDYVVQDGDVMVFKHNA